MPKLFDLNDKGEVVLTKYGLSVPEFKVLKEKDHTVGKTYFRDQITYIFFVYDRDSPYFKVSPLRDRQRTVLADKLPDYESEDFEQTQLVHNAINKFNYLEFTINERVYNQCVLKFGEYKCLFSETPVSHDNFAELSKEMNSAMGIFETMKKIEHLIRTEERTETKNYGNYKPSMLELGILDNKS